MKNDTTAPRGLKRRVRNTSAECEIATRLNKYYTNRDVARECSILFERYISPDAVIVEPSAGDGAFLDTAQRPILGYDIAPDRADIMASDFIADGLSPALREIGGLAFIGNPPFSLAIEFINRSLSYADTVGFILPFKFRKWRAQQQIDSRARLVLDHELPPASYTHCGRPFGIHCAFQVWTLNEGLPDLRLKAKPPATHPDFTIWQYNRTPDAERFFDYPWDFAVPRQGSFDYTFKAYRAEECNPRRQWMFFQANDGAVLKRLLDLDFTAISRFHSPVPGLSRPDIVAAYERHRG